MFYIFFCLFPSLYSLTQTFISASCMFSFVLPNLSETAFHLFQIALILLHDFGRTPLKFQFRSGIRPEPLLNLKISTKLKTSSSQLWSLWTLNDRMHYWEYICPCQFLLDKKSPDELFSVYLNNDFTVFPLVIAFWTHSILLPVLFILNKFEKWPFHYGVFSIEVLLAFENSRWEVRYLKHKKCCHVYPKIYYYSLMI